MKTKEILEEIGKYYENVEQDQNSLVLKSGRWLMSYAIDDDDINLTCYISSPVSGVPKNAYEKLNELNIRASYGTYMFCDFGDNKGLYCYHSIISLESFKKSETKKIIEALNSEAEKGLVVLTMEEQFFQSSS